MCFVSKNVKRTMWSTPSTCCILCLSRKIKKNLVLTFKQFRSNTKLHYLSFMRDKQGIKNKIKKEEENEPCLSLSEILVSSIESRKLILSSVSGSLPWRFGIGSFGDEIRTDFQVDPDTDPDLDPEVEEIGGNEIGGLGDRSW